MKSFEHLSGCVIGIVSAVQPKEIQIRLSQEAPQAIALNAGFPTAFPRINSYVLLPNESGATVGLVSRIWMTEAGPLPDDGRTVALPYPVRRLALTPVGTLLSDGADYQLARGVTSLPGVGDVAALPSARQLQAIVEGNGDDRRLLLGTAPFGNDAKVMVDPDKLFGRHLAVLGNTGSGKSCTVAGLVRWSLDAAQEKIDSALGPGIVGPNGRFIILDPNGEYKAAFANDGKNVRRFVVGEEEGAESLAVPAWLWNGQEWSAFTDAKPGSQRPLLLKTLRALRNSVEGEDAVLSLLRRTIAGQLTLLRQVRAGFPQSVLDWKDNNALAARLVGIAEGLRADVEKLPDQGFAQHRNTFASVADRIDGVVAGRRWAEGRYNQFQQTDIENPISWLSGEVEPLLPADTMPDIGEDAPVEFDVGRLPNRLNDFAVAMGSGSVQHVEPLVNRIEVMLADARMRSLVSPPSGTTSLLAWLNAFVGDDSPSASPVVIIDLSLVPSDVVHIAVSVIARLTFEALQRYRKQHTKPLPTTIILEEAHTFIRKDGEHGLNAPAADTCRQTFERIAREGRKFGLGLVLSSQRPSELSPTVLAQCNSFLLHRLVNDIDQALVRRLVPDALGELLGELPTLPSQQAILLGWAAPLPVLVKIRDLPKEQRPQSDDPDFWNVWTREEPRPVNWQPIADDWVS